MKKKYYTPVVDLVSVKANAIMTTASGVINDDGDPQTQEERGHFDKQGTGQSRNDWDNIWSGM